MSDLVELIPEEWQTGHRVPYGQTLGVALGNVTAYSNGDAKHVVLSPNTEKGIYTGLQWQCVEFARRWLFINKGVVFGDVDTASDIWNETHFVTRVSDGRQFPLQSYLNGSTEPPQVGDLLIYVKEYLSTGHVAVVTKANPAIEVIKVAEQNLSNRRWPANHARQIALVRKNGRFWLLDPYLLGWKRMVNYSS